MLDDLIVILKKWLLCLESMCGTCSACRIINSHEQTRAYFFTRRTKFLHQRHHLKEAVFCSSPHRASLILQYLTGVVNLLCAGRAPQAVVPHICGAYLLPCRKKDGGLRPIAVGEVLRRLTFKCAARAVLSNVLQLLSPLQVGVGLPGGCDTILYSVTSIHGDTSISSDHKLTLLVDFSNAFNSIDHATMFHETRSRLPSLSSWMECSYGSQPTLLLDNFSILSCCGV